MPRLGEQIGSSPLANWFPMNYGLGIADAETNRMTREVDVAVIGAGPAGLSAARVVAEAGLTCLVIDRMGPGGELMNLGEVFDVSGYDAGATGPDLIAALADRAMSAGAELAIDDVAHVDGLGPFSVATSEGQVVATAVVIATGLEKGTTGAANEASFEGRGLSHCANCDGPLYAGRRVVVAGRDRWAAEEAIALAAMTEHVTLVSDGRLEALPPDRQAAFDALSNVSRVDGRITALEGSDGIEAVMAGTTRIPAAGLFVFTNRLPATTFLHGLLSTAASGHLAVGEGGATNVPGIYAAGDVASPANRIAQAIAAGEAAGQNAVRWVEEHALDG